MRKVTIYDHRRKPLQIKEGLPPKLVNSMGYRVFDKHYIENSKNYLLFQICSLNQYFIEIDDYLIQDTSRASYYCRAQDGAIYLQFCLRGKAYFKMFKRAFAFEKRGTSNLLVFGSVDNIVHFKEQGRHTILNFIIPEAKLKALAKRYPFLEFLLPMTAKGKFDMLYERCHLTTNEMLLLICEILYHLEKDTIDTTLIEGLIEKLIVVFMDSYKHEIHKDVLDFETMMGLFKAKLHFDEEGYRCTVLDAQEASGLDHKKFSRTFKIAFGMSPQDYLIAVKMNKARHILLYEPLDKLSDLATLVGYKTLKYFLMQYHKFHGVSAKEDFDRR